MADISAIDLAGWGTLIGATIGAILKALKSDSTARAAKAEAEKIKVQRAETKLARDAEFQRMCERMAVLENDNKHLTQRLDDGNSRFERLEDKLDDVVKRQDDTNKLLCTLIGEFKSLSRTPQHTPEVGL